jgi:hypothetical protein
LQPLFNLLEVVTRSVLLLSCHLLPAGQGDGLLRQAKDLVERGIISHKGSPYQGFSGCAQGRQVDLEKAGDSVIVIEAQSVTIRDSNQKEIEQDLRHGELLEKACRDKAVIDPTEGALDPSNSLRAKEPFDGHCFTPRRQWGYFSKSKGSFLTDFVYQDMEYPRKAKPFQLVEALSRFVYQDGMIPTIGQSSGQVVL